ncbi:acyltransferase [Capsulimonas corticalis]|uniref:Acyltransferase n=1 Tax=Capsulimonas corticalis TaxID=2219043 RepID=A0A402CVL3_9BACT|nr:acyltransferase [Capsulimonas corticalis]BDI30444.1 acyltransferase [Capsulimonas corticalis]
MVITDSPDDAGAISSSTAPSAVKPEAPHRMMQLDFLRGIAILLVICFHGVVPARSAGVLAPITMHLNRMGWSGVDLFFVLSGFLVGGLLFKECLSTGRLDVRRFFVRRIFKIWPSYYLFLIYLAVRMHFTSDEERAGTSRSLIPNLLHYQNYIVPFRGHTWSLAVEEHFYLILPLLLVFLTSRAKDAEKSLRVFPWIVGAVAVICLGLRYLTSFHTPWAQVTHYFPTHLRIDSLFFGAALAYVYHARPEILARVMRYRTLLFFVGLALVFPAALFPIRTKIMSVGGFTALFLGYGCILLAVIHTAIGEGPAGRFLGSRLARGVAFIGVYSYPIYLWHIDAMTLPLKSLARHGFLGGLPGSLRWLVFMTVYIAGATLVGVIMGRLVEKPALKLRDRLFPSRIDPLVSAGDSRGPHLAPHEVPAA